MRRPALKTVARLTGAALIAFGALHYWRVARAETDFRWEPLSLPTSLSTGSIRTPEFVTDTAPYDIQLDFKDGPGAENIDCYPSAPRSLVEACGKAPPLVDVSWQLFKGSERVETGTSTNGTTVYEGTNGTDHKILGRFQGEKGYTYTLVFTTNRDAPGLRKLQPKLVVSIPIGLKEDYAMGFAFRQLEGCLTALLGLAILFVPWIAGKLKSRTVDARRVADP
jgi:hypothetical protein